MVGSKGVSGNMQLVFLIKPERFWGEEQGKGLRTVLLGKLMCDKLQGETRFTDCAAAYNDKFVFVR